MRLARYLYAGEKSWGVVDPDTGTVRRIRGAFEQWAPAVTSGDLTAIESDAEPVALGAVKLLAPLAPTSEIAGVGLNWTSGVVPPEGSDGPVYNKPLSSITDPGETLRFPDLISVQPQARYGYEIQLALVFGTLEIDETDPLGAVLGYTIANDGTLRHGISSFVGEDLFGAKSGYQGSSLGPWIVTRGEFEQQTDHTLTTRVNGTVVQQGSTKEMRLSLDDTIREVFHRMVLTTGDVLLTGTPGYLAPYQGIALPGDRLELEISGIGVLRNHVQDTNPYPVHESQRWGGAGSLPGVLPVPVGGPQT
ncbi:2-keto-4-pentenoate hydratase/2-oxohepta-3-ene-1,7-dioic acid hydratase in catechol pathway [Streptomyces sp. LBL]|uniref:fumarylacetoacetate hydrolase family protein n=1 Tax=Streptomyces sp. LBL TaxID=2940562 RepID=UPI0024765CAF|nr:fumarylacetoacetate hydrolase family protein [Streptomyces sp. LBL]MDH6629842.1 2-keto-4-pentenoate hydratase/2-oxohepta-3-ene-1,7-dioic acid hydratase in catechol pathway [Streptomyces sp. LBL]